mgnify:CR=1 FL=1
MIKRTLLAAAIFSALPVYAGLTSITAGYDFTDYSGDHGNRQHHLFGLRYKKAAAISG